MSNNRKKQIRILRNYVYQETALLDDGNDIDSGNLETALKTFVSGDALEWDSEPKHPYSNTAAIVIGEGRKAIYHQVCIYNFFNFTFFIEQKTVEYLLDYPTEDLESYEEFIELLEKIEKIEKNSELIFCMVIPNE